MNRHILKLSHSTRLLIITEMSQLVIPHPQRIGKPEEQEQMADSCILVAVVARECFPETGFVLDVDMLRRATGRALSLEEARECVENTRLLLRDGDRQWVCRVEAVKYLLRTWFPGVERRQARLAPRISSHAPQSIE